MVKRIGYLEGVMNVCEALAGLKSQDRSDVFNDTIGEITVDTCCACDTGEWETGIKRDGEWIIVEQYSCREEALEGHKKWVEKIKENPDLPLEDINVWGL